MIARIGSAHHSQVRQPVLRFGPDLPVAREYTGPSEGGDVPSVEASIVATRVEPDVILRRWPVWDTPSTMDVIPRMLSSHG